MRRRLQEGHALIAFPNMGQYIDLVCSFGTYSLRVFQAIMCTSSVHVLETATPSCPAVGEGLGETVLISSIFNICR